MKILYINGWSVLNPLTLASTFPSLHALARLSSVSEITLLSPENGDVELVELDSKVRHVPLKVRSNGILSYIINEFKYVFKLWRICKDRGIIKIIARGAPAGGRASFISAALGIPYIVESFEPHSQYMLDSKVWSANDPRYVIQRLWERRIKKTAAAVITVSNNYANWLIEEGMDRRRIFVVPCTVDLEHFSFDIADRASVRARFGIPLTDTVGIYVGKFGDIYFSLNDSLSIFEDAFQGIKNFQLIVLTDCAKEEFFLAVKSAGCEHWLDRVHVLRVPHDEVPVYLSASDFAYSLIKTGSSKKFCSPLKNGEYWANGLPIVIPEDIGDDSDIILNSGLGVVIRREENYSYLPKLFEILSRDEHRVQCMALASRYRTRRLISKAYEDIGLS